MRISTNARSLTGDAIHLFALLGMVFIPVDNLLLPVQTKLADTVFGPLIAHLLRYQDLQPVSSRISSDSTSMYWLLALLLGLALTLRLLFSFTRRNGQLGRFRQLVRLLALYYLAYRLLEYGADKLFKGQFYQPEPNTLYTPFGLLDRDLLYWSTMGLSWPYNCFLGAGEVLAAILLLFRGTRMAGLLLSLFILANIVAINFGFDISVKLYSLFLTFLVLLALGPSFRPLYRFFFRQELAQVQPASFTLFSRPIHTGLKVFALGFLLINVGWPYLRAGQWNSDRAERPHLHGAYEVVATYLEGDTTPALNPFKRAFIHRNGYFILQSPDDRMQDFRMALDTGNRLILLTNYEGQQSEIRYAEKDSLLEFYFISAPQHFRLLTRKLPWERLPALQPSFHWTVESSLR